MSDPVSFTSLAEVNSNELSNRYGGEQRLAGRVERGRYVRGFRLYGRVHRGCLQRLREQGVDGRRPEIKGELLLVQVIVGTVLC